MARRISLTGQNSSDIYTISFPNNLINFIKYDFTIFMERSIDLCRFYMKSGEYRQEEVLEIRNSISGCHKFFEQNIRTTFDKVVTDCWIEYICRQNEIGTVTLWNNYMQCRNEFERVIFTRLCEYRHNQAINQWVNMLKIQEYALRKVDFVFGQKLRNSVEAAARANYFDLMFNVAANEIGYEITGVPDNKVYGVGRTPNSPFVLSNISREIVRNILQDIKYHDDSRAKRKAGGQLSDQNAMDAFSAIKGFLPSEPDSIINTMVKSMAELPQKVYMPTGFKAVIDLEIDALVESGGIMQRCQRCHDYYLRDEEYNYDYCDRIGRDGRSCLDIMHVKEEESPKPLPERAIDTTILNMRCDQLYKEMSARVNVDITQRDLSDWYKYMMLIRENVIAGKASMEDFDHFVEYTRAINFSYSKPAELDPEPEPEAIEPERTPRGKEVKPFVFERIDRSRLEEQDSLLYEAVEPVRPAAAKKRHYEEEAHVMPQEAAVSSKIIRGAAQKIRSYDHSFDTPSVTIPVEEAPPRRRAEPPEQVSMPREVSSPREMVSPREVLDSAAYQDEAPEDDVKIYNIKEYIPETREEFVKVFEPVGGKRAERSAPRFFRQKPREPEAEPIFQPEPEVQYPAPSPQYERIAEPERAERPHPYLTSPGAGSPGAGERSGLSEIRSQAEDTQRRTLSPPRPSATPREEVVRQYTPASAGGDVERDSAFSDVLLRGLERSDGFEETMPTDADGVPVSHKTKRVMDAIFKPSKTTLFMNPKNDDK